ncbi:Regulator of sigma-W protease RasP [bacterium HR19]|nr:Regulator of sigma-W protease RasP [bacterium HR19]
MTVLYVIVAVLILGFIIFFHELGHFLFARMFKVKVLSFSVGFGPAIWRKNIGGTEYRISAIPFGGYVSPLERTKIDILAEEVKERLRKDKLISSLKEEYIDLLVWEEIEKNFGFSREDIQKHSLESRPFWQKFLVVFAGPLFNIILAFFSIYILLLVGLPSLGTKVGKVMENSPAERIGVKPGDEVIEINGRRVKTWDDVRRNIAISRDKVIIKVKRGEEIIEFTAEPEFRNGRKVIGILPDENSKIMLKYSVFSALPESLKFSYDFMTALLKSIPLLFSREGVESIGGPISIAKFTADAVSEGISSVLMISFFMNINLAVLNLLPIPVLDGGNILIFFVESLVRRRLSYRVRGAIAIFGLFILLAVAALATFNDIKGIIMKKI